MAMLNNQRVILQYVSSQTLYSINNNTYVTCVVRNLTIINIVQHNIIGHVVLTHVYFGCSNINTKHPNLRSHLGSSISCPDEPSRAASTASDMNVTLPSVYSMSCVTGWFRRPSLGGEMLFYNPGMDLSNTTQPGYCTLWLFNVAMV